MKMNGSENDVVLGRHLDSLSTTIANKLATMSGSGGGTISVFTGATSSTGGASGLVPAPDAGDNKKFLRGDGAWANANSSGGGVVLDTVASGVEGALWKGLANDVPALKLRHGDYEYNFRYDDITYLGGASSVVETVEPDTYILGNDSVSSEGGVWYEVSGDDTPKLWFHSGSFNYGINYDTITYKGDNSNLVAYLPFDVSTTADACGNTWTENGTPTIVDNSNSFGGKAISLNGSAWLSNDTISASIGSSPWAIDFWAYVTDSRSGSFFATTYVSNRSFEFNWNQGAPQLYTSDGTVTGSITAGTNQQHHYAITYDGTTVRIFVDGVLSASATRNLTLTGKFYIGSSNGNSTCRGNIDHFRIRTGAIWTSDFTVPTASDYL